MNEISKRQAVNLLQNADLSKTGGHKIYFFSLSLQKTGKEIVAFGDIEIEKWKFHHSKDLILLEYVDTDSMLISSIVSPGKKYIFYWFQRK